MITRLWFTLSLTLSLLSLITLVSQVSLLWHSLSHSVSLTLKRDSLTLSLSLHSTSLTTISLNSELCSHSLSLSLTLSLRPLTLCSKTKSSLSHTLSHSRLSLTHSRHSGGSHSSLDEPSLTLSLTSRLSLKGLTLLSHSLSHVMISSLEKRSRLSNV